MRCLKHLLLTLSVTFSALAFAGPSFAAGDPAFYFRWKSALPQLSETVDPADPAETGEDDGEQEGPEVELALSGGTLPTAVTGEAWDFDFSSLLTAVGVNKGDVSFSIVPLPGEEFPGWMSMGGGGSAVGYPDRTGSYGFEVVASYGDVESRLSYAVVISGKALDARRITAGQDHTCAIVGEGKVMCWGYDSYGQIGDGKSRLSGLDPTEVDGVLFPSMVSAGGDFTCTLMLDSTVVCWGRSNRGQMGRGTLASGPHLPQSIPGLAGVTMIATGQQHACVVVYGGSVMCWGLNDKGQAGNDSLANQSTPFLVPGVSGATSVAAGTSHSCALLNDGSVKCWGVNSSGQLGDGSNTNSAVPVQVSGLSGAVAIGSRGQHTCAVISDGSLRCWGKNDSGQLGNRTLTDSNVPVVVPGLSGVMEVSTGLFSTCTIDFANRAKCWGSGVSGALGQGRFEGSLEPVEPLGLEGLTGIVSGNRHACAIVPGDVLKCWGDNNYHQLGDGSGVAKNAPQLVVVN